MSDPYTEECVLCGKTCEPNKDFCGECFDSGADEDNFGRCYQCKDYHDHEHCVGVPCQCKCPTPDQRKREADIEAALAKLTPYERGLLGHLKIT
jgi:hypothetical protein